MGMRLHYVSIPESDIARLRADEELAPSLLMGTELAGIPQEALAAMRKQLQAAGLSSLMPGLSMGGTGKPSPDTSIARADAVRGVLEKAWHGLHFVFSGVADEAMTPQGYLLSGGEEVGDDLGYGPARVLRASEVRALRDALKAISDKEFDRRFDLEAFENLEIYPGIWDEDRNELLDEYLMYFHQLQSDLDRVVQAGEALLIALI